MVASLGFTLHVSTDFDELACLAGLDERLNQAMIDTAYDGTDIIYDLAVAYINKRTGRTAGTIGEEVIPHGNGGTGYVGSNDMIAKILEFGSRAHPIDPINAEALHFEGTFASHVDHPGTRPYEWLLRAGQDSFGPVCEVAMSNVEAALVC